MSDNSLSSLTESLSRDPRDKVTINALADWIEERGGEPENVRRLTVEDGDVIVLGIPDYVMQQEGLSSAELMSDFNPFSDYQTLAAEITDWFEAQGVQVLTLIAPAAMTVRQIRARQEKEQS